MANVVPAVGHAGLGGLAGEHAGEHGVVPVHRPAGLRLERVGTVANGVGHHVGGSDPVGARLADTLAESGAAAQRVLDAGRPGEQCVVPRPGVGLDRPQREAVVAAQRQHELEGPLDGRPHVLGEAAVPGVAQVVAHAGGDVGAHVGVELGVLDRSVGSGSTHATTRRAVACRRATRRPARPRRGSRRRRGPSRSRRGSTGRSGRRGTTGSSRCRAAARRDARR